MQPTAPEPETSVRVFWPLLDYLRSVDVAPDVLLAGTGFTEARLRAPDLRIPRSTARSIVRCATTASGEPALGFRVAAFIRPETFDVLEYAARSSATIADAIRVTNRYARLIDDTAEFSLEPQGERAMWRFRVDLDETLRCFLVELLFAALGNVGLRIFGELIPAEEAWCAYPRPAHYREYDRHLTIPVRFDAPHHALLFRHETLASPLPAADPVLGRLLERHADELLARRAPPLTYTGRVRRCILEELHGGNPDMSRVVEKLRTTPSTLRRRLAEEGTSFRALLEAARAEMARHYLEDARLSIAEVAFLLAFRDVSAFHRSFKRWTGKTPAEYRATTRGAHPERGRSRE